MLPFPGKHELREADVLIPDELKSKAEMLSGTNNIDE